MEDKKSKEIRRAQIKKQKSILCIGFIVIICAAVGIIYKMSAAGVDTSAGIKTLNKMQAVKVADREKKIDALEETALKEEENYQNRPVKEKFKNSVVMGDSISEGLVDYDILDSSSVIAEIGIAITNTKAHVKKAEGMNPKCIFLAYGMNDIEGADGDPQIFKGWYKDLLDELKNALPDTKIFVNSILPVQQKEIDREPNYAHLNEFNQVLEALCTEEGVTFLNNTDLVQEDYFEPDGVHMSSDYYPGWVQKMAEAAEL